jgi:hypothetical protein
MMQFFPTLQPGSFTPAVSAIATPATSCGAGQLAQPLGT